MNRGGGDFNSLSFPDKMRRRRRSALEWWQEDGSACDDGQFSVPSGHLAVSVPRHVRTPRFGCGVDIVSVVQLEK
ncbi:hypothetical protein D5086_030958 [Populus alba]|uniref:Uncharacterized protein n=1 Tax=Populus alba TaxID=43335 RepID=A0ACC4APZ7_POPAL